MQNRILSAGMAFSLVAAGVTSPAAAQSPSAPVAVPSAPRVTLTPQQQAVWQGEETYWKYVNARDLKGYLTLWHPNFTGWPCNTEHPADLAGLAKWAAGWFSEKAKAGEVATPQVEAVVVDGDFAITYLSTRSETSVDGVKQIKLQKFVHTWKATDHGWKIIGGMCAPLERSE
jgi:hypothetical protein